MFDVCVVYVLVCTQHGLRDCYVPRTKNTTQYCDGISRLLLYTRLIIPGKVCHILMTRIT